LIAASGAHSIWKTLAAHAQHRARLSRRRHAHFEFPGQAGHVNLAAQGGLREADRHLAHDVFAHAAKERVARDLNHQLQIAGRLVDAHAVARLAHRARRAVLDAGGDLDGERAFALRQPLAAADAAGREHHLSRPTTARAGALDGDRKQGLLKAHLAAPAARRTRFDPRARLGAATRAAFTGVEPLVAHLALTAQRGFFEAQLQVPANVAAVAGADAERAQQIAEQIFEAGHVAEVDPARGPTAGTEGGLTVAVEGSPLVPITQDLMCEIGLLETYTGLRIPRVLVGVVDRSQTAKGRLDLGFGSPSANAEHFIRVAHPPGVAFSPGVFPRLLRSWPVWPRIY